MLSCVQLEVSHYYWTCARDCTKHLFSVLIPLQRYAYILIRIINADFDGNEFKF